MEKNLEKNLKRYLKRKVKITLGFIVAFLLSCNFVSAEGIEITQGDNGEILFDQEIEGNTFENNIYTNNIKLKDFFYNEAKGLSLINENLIKVKSDFDGIIYGIDNYYGEITQLINNGKLEVTGQEETNGIRNSYGIIGSVINNRIIKVTNSFEDEAYGINNFGGEITEIVNNETLKVTSENKAIGIYNYEKGKINKIVNNGIMNIVNLWYDSYGINNYYGKIEEILNNGILKVNGSEQTVGINNYKNKYGTIGDKVNNGIIDNIINNGTIKVLSSSEKAWGIDNSGGEISEIEKNGIFKVKGEKNTVGIGNYNNTINIYDEETGEEKEEILKGTIDNIINNGMTNILNNEGIVWGIDNNGGKISEIENNGIFKVKGIYEVIGIENNNYTLEIYDEETGEEKEETLKGIIDNIINNGTINVENTNYQAWGIKNTGEKISEIINNGILDVRGKNKTIGIEISGEGVDNLTNKGVIKVLGNNSSSTFGIKNSALILNKQELINDGIVFSNKIAIDWTNGDTATNNGLLIGNSNIFIENKNSIKNGMMFSYDEINKNYKIYGVGKNSDTIINAELLNEKDKDTPNWIADGSKSIDFTNKNEREKTFNGITDTLAVKGTSSLTDGTVNGYTNAVIFDKAGGELTLNNSIINGGIAEKSFAVRGQKGNDVLSLLNKTIINGNINLGTGDDKLTINNTVQLNGVLNGGKGTEDNLIFNSSAKSLEENLNIRYNISGFENTTVDTKVTLFEKTLDNKDRVKNLSAQLGDITITKNGELTLRIDGAQKDDDTGKIIGHALYGNNGLITSDGGKLLFALNGVKEGATIDLGKTKLDKTMIGNDEIDYSRDITLDTTSLLHNITKIDSSSVKVSTAKNLPYVDILNYNELNKIYQSIRSVDKVGEFNVDNDKKLTAFTKYLHDIYVANPYAYSSELSRKTMSMMKNLADKDLNPELNKWAIYGGLTHTDGGTENSYYGKGYYTYDIGSRDISADTKISGGYFKAEYGKANDLTTGIIFGGNNSETEIGASKVEGDSFYFGTYAKKYINNFRFTFGAGFEHGDYKADRTAIGYDGITETRKYGSNYHDRGFNIYADTKYTKELGNGFYFEPSVTLEYSYVDQDGVSEDGVLAIETDSKNFDYLSGTINLDLRKEIKSDKFTHSLIAGVSYEKMLSGYDEEYITGRIKGGTNFDILVPEKEKDIFSLNAKYELETEKGFIFDVKGSYRFEHDTNKDEWIVGTGIGYKF